MRYVVVHGHFYQPPRENPWTERVDPEASASPFPDWNERVHRECYAPNRAVRMLDAGGRIREVVSNYERISFNFGPTLLDWMLRAHPRTVEALREADRSVTAKRGRGNAIAQAYNHPILPLLPRRDKTTQVRWGLAHFAHVYGRRAHGMWLPETAADTETLDVLAEEGISFTVLAPHQATRVRSDPGAPWRPPAGMEVIGRPLRCVTGPGREIALFFYDSELAHGVAFGGLLGNGDDLAAALRTAARDRPETAPAVHLATDGETFGHHHRFSEMALARALFDLEKEEDIRILDYASLLEEVPPTEEVQVEGTGSWSCPHGVERWRSDCGCTTGGEPGWTQAWRAPLREGLDHLAAGLHAAFEREGGRQFRDPWEARDGYIEVLLDPGSERRREFLSRHGRPGHDPSVAWRLLEAERAALLMFTSCGWFFADLDGLEGRQVLRYAARALELVTPFVEPKLGEETRRILAGARSNAPPHRTGADLLAPRETGALGPAALAAEAVLLAEAKPADLLSPPPAAEVILEFETRTHGRVEVRDRSIGTRSRFTFRTSASPGVLPRAYLGEEGADPHRERLWTLFDLDPSVEALWQREWEEIGDGEDRECLALLAHFHEFLRAGGPAGSYYEVEERARTLRSELEERGGEELATRLTPAFTAALGRVARRLGAEEPEGQEPSRSLLSLLDGARVLAVEPDVWEAQTCFWEARDRLSSGARAALTERLGFASKRPRGRTGKETA